MTDVRTIEPGDQEWPVGLDGLRDDKPERLWVRGAPRLDHLTEMSVSVVGSRAATQYGNHVAAEMAGALAERSWTVVSGGAYGVDSRAHLGALTVDGKTVVVLPCGIDVTFPTYNAAMFQRIVERGGMLVSELPPGSVPSRARFLRRNRITAALTDGTVVVEAALRSGSLATAHHAARMGRAVMAVPGPVTSAQSAGCHQLLRNGEAVCVTDAAEVEETIKAHRTLDHDLYAT